MKKLLFALVILVVVVPMFIKGPDGQPIMSFSDWMPAKPQVKSPVSSSSPEYYRYRDVDGNWQYTDRPPEDGEYELVQVDTSVNNIQSTPLPSPSKEESQQTTVPGIAGYVQDLQSVQQEAEQVQQIMDDREARLEEMLKQSQ